MQIYDEVYGKWIELSESAAAIYNTPHFQRLAKIKQLTPLHKYYAKAQHTRMDHCIGVAHAAKQLYQHLLTTSSSLPAKHRAVAKRYEICVEIAGLCHDLGHGPFSHIFERILKASSSSSINDDECSGAKHHEFNHEQCSVQLLKDVVESDANNVRTILQREAAIGPEQLELVYCMILGERDQYFVIRNKIYKNQKKIVGKFLIKNYG
ncbi:MAG: SAM domain and HD [Marteilia pararefringens]